MEAISQQADFVQSAGLWAGRQFQQYGLNAQALRTNATLQRDEWVHFDTVLVEELTIRLQAIADLYRFPGLIVPVDKAMGKTMYEYEKGTDMQPAIRSMDGRSRSRNDRYEYSQTQIPIFITHKDFDIHLRALEASRNRGEALDTTQARISARLVSESLEDALVNGAGVVINGVQGYGYRTHPNRNTGGFVANGHWGAGVAKIGSDFINDVLKMKSGLAADRHHGPYMIYLPADADVALDADFKAGTDGTIRKRILEVDKVAGITVLDQLPSGNVLMVSMTPDVVQLLDGEGIQTVQWEIEGGFVVKHKVLAIQVPIVKAAASGRSGIYHLS